MSIKVYSGDEKYIFISYSHKDLDTVLRIAEYLSKAGFRIWYDEGIAPGSEWDDMIASRIEKAYYFVAMMSKNYMDSDNCKDELSFARDLKKERLLIYLDEVNLTGGMKMRMNRIQSIFQYKYADENAFYEKLLTTKDIELCRAAKDADEAEVDRSPKLTIDRYKKRAKVFRNNWTFMRERQMSYITPEGMLEGVKNGYKFDQMAKSPRCTKLVQIVDGINLLALRDDGELLLITPTEVRSYDVPVREIFQDSSPNSVIITMDGRVGVVQNALPFRFNTSGTEFVGKVGPGGKVIYFTPETVGVLDNGKVTCYVREAYIRGRKGDDIDSRIKKAELEKRYRESIPDIGQMDLSENYFIHGDKFCALTKEGRVLSAGPIVPVQWNDMAKISYFWGHLVGLTRSGQIVSTDSYVQKLGLSRVVDFVWDCGDLYVLDEDCVLWRYVYEEDGRIIDEDVAYLGHFMHQSKYICNNGLVKSYLDREGNYAIPEDMCLPCSVQEYEECFY